MENLQPGPLDKSVLYDQDRHISERVWQGNVSMVCLKDVEYHLVEPILP